MKSQLPQFFSLKLKALALHPREDKVALAFSDHKIRLFKPVLEPVLLTWSLLHTLVQHSDNISSLNWSIQNHILSTSFDRSAVVWVQDTLRNQWNRELCSINNKFGLTCGQWSPNGLKFAVGDAKHQVFICSKGIDNIWVSTHLLNCKSQILQIRFHPSGRALGVCSADVSFHLIKAAIKEQFQDHSYKGLFAQIKAQESNNQLFDYKANPFKGWVNGCAFSPDGLTVAIFSHTNQLSLLNLAKMEIIHHQWRGLPLKCGVWVGKQLFVGGWDKKVGNFKEGKINWLQKNLMSDVVVKSKKGHVNRIASMYQKKVLNSMSKLGQSAKQQFNPTCHLNVIDGLVFDERKNRVWSHDVNGIIHIWPL